MKRLVAASAAAGCALVVYLARLDEAAGLYVDDAWYVVLATALANGDGYRLISSATDPIVPTFPPGFPILLAPIVALTATFPANVAVLKGASIAAMFAIAGLTYWYVHRAFEAPRRVAAAAALVTLFMPAFVFLATSTIMAEATFTLCQLLLLAGVERARRAGHVSDRWAFVCGIVAGATILVRLAGVAAAAAAALCLWQARRRAAVIFVALTAACYVPWALYNTVNEQPAAERLAHGGSVAYRYPELLSFRIGGEPNSGRATLGDIPVRALENVVNLFGRDIGAQLFPSAYRGTDESGQEVFLVSGLRGFRATGMGTGAQIIVVSSLLSLVVVTGFIATCRRRVTVSEWMVVFTLGMLLLVPVPTYRYALPLAPFVAFYFFAGVDAIAAAVKRTRPGEFGAAFRISAACILVLFMIDHAGYLQGLRADRGTWQMSHQEVRGVIEFMNNELPDGTVATSNPGLVWLLTGRKTVALMNPLTHWSEWQAAGIRYVVTLHVTPQPPPWLGYRTLYESPRLRLWVLEITAGADRK
jgi:hypothetical protein